MSHTIESIRDLLSNSDRAVVKAMFAIQKRQTADEQAGHLTRHTNGIGWSKFDAPWMADMIAKYNRWGSLTPKQLAVTRNKVKRYARQLLEIALETEASRAAIPAAPATMPSVSPDGVTEQGGTYKRMQSYCDCENYDGERKCPYCERIEEKDEFARLERLAEQAGFASDPDYASF